MSEHRLRILHLSDLHERVGLDQDTWKRRIGLGRAWEKNLDAMVEDGHPVDLICITGDIAYQGLEAEYTAATGFIEALWKRLSLAPDRLFLVPGNHDIQRSVASGAWTALCKGAAGITTRAWSKWMAGVEPLAGVEPSHREQILTRGSAFRGWIASRLGRGELLPERSPHGLLGYRVTLALPDFPFDVHVIGLDSAWMCGGDDDPGNILLTEDQVESLSTDAKGAPLSGFRLALIHHPLTILADHAECRDLLTTRADLLLRGHLHREEIAALVEPGAALRQIAAGCLYKGRGAAAWPNTCNVIDVTLDEAGHPHRYDVRVRAFSLRGGGAWLDDSVLAKDAPGGRITWQLEVPKRALVKRPEGVFVGRTAEITAIATAFFETPHDPRPIALGAVHGMHGVGKSYLADRFTSLYAYAFPGGVYRIALDPTDARLSVDLLCEIARRLDISESSPNLAGVVRTQLRHDRALVLIENVDTVPVVRAVAALVSSLLGCTILITGRARDLGNTEGWVGVPIAPFDEPTALDLLAAEAGASPTARNLGSWKRLSRALDYVPLALALAAGYLRNGFSADHVLELLRRRGLDVPRDDLTSPALVAYRNRAIPLTSFELALDLFRSELSRALGPDADASFAGFAALASSPIDGFGRSLGAVIANLSNDKFDLLIESALALRLLQRLMTRSDAWMVHPLLAELLRASDNKAEAMQRLSRVQEWFLERLPEFPAGQEALQGERWKEIRDERGMLAVWLSQVLPDDIARVERAGSRFAMRMGPFKVWMDFCERALAITTEPHVRSNLLWTLAHVANSAGNFFCALAAAQEKEDLDRRLGKEREAALAIGLRADILEARGQLDDAMRVRYEEELPAYDRIGDARSRAVSLGKVAGIHQTRGQLDEAMRIRREEQVPVFERIGDARERAITLGHIADILQARGQLDEAVRIREDEELPVYREQGAHYRLVVGLADLALTHLKRGRPGDREKAAELLRSALADAEALHFPEVEQLRTIQALTGLNKV